MSTEPNVITTELLLAIPVLQLRNRVVSEFNQSRFLIESSGLPNPLVYLTEMF